MDNIPLQQRPEMSRRRTAYACVSCRTRKSRCDGHDPCSTCQTLNVECSFDHIGSSSKGKSDLILNAIHRLEESVFNIDLSVAALRQDVKVSQTSVLQQSPAALTQYSGERSFGGRSQSFTRASPADYDPNSLTNATISDHTSTTEAILRWPVFDRFPMLRTEQILKSGAIFSMENASQRSLTPETSLPLLSQEELDRLFATFSESVNFYYPLLSHQELEDIAYHYVTNRTNHSTKTCLTLLVIALGCATETVRDTTQGANRRQIMRIRHLGMVHFDAAIYRLHVAHSLVNAEATQCLALAALYYAYLQRPIQAWSTLSSTAAKCRVLLSYGVATPEESECVRRIFWMCFILESDYLAELPALPRFGIADMESDVPLPGQYVCHKDEALDELSSVYFLACISMRRFLNRCHHLLFGQDKSAKLSQQRLAEIVSELNQQLEEWRRLLPPSLQFNIDTEPVAAQQGAFLRQRYLTCLALLYRPYVITALSDYIAGRSSEQKIVDGARRCLQACVMHILNLRSLDQTVMVDTWICSLSMAGTMMILLASTNVYSLRDFIGEHRFVLGPHLTSLLHIWVEIHGESPSPSIKQAIDWIQIASEAIQAEL